MYFFHGRNTLNDLVYHSSSYFTRVLFDRDSHSGGTPACRDRPRVCPHLRQGEICCAVGRPSWRGYRTDTGSVPTCGLTPELAERGGGQIRGYVPTARIGTRLFIT